ncbi:MAG: tetratricopeptide repeat protein [Nonlabens sp.]
MHKNLITLISLLFLVTSPIVIAQEEVAQQEVNVDDLGNVKDEFKELFFNALAEKGKMNYDRAIDLLDKCIVLEPENAAVHFELGKNYLMSNAFAKAEQALNKAIEIKGKDEWLLDTLYEVHTKNNDHDQALATLLELISINENYEELLPLQYLKTGQQDKALEVIERLDERLGKSRNRTFMKQQVLSQMSRPEPELDEQSLLKEIENNPDNEDAYIKLIYYYGKQENNSKVIETAAKLEKNIPQSDKAQLALYKIYLEQGSVEKGMASMQRIFESAEFDDRTKMRVLNDFIQVENADATNLENVASAISVFAGEVEDIQTLTLLGDFYLKKKDPDNALAFYEKGLQNDSENFDLIKKVALLSIDSKDFNRVASVTESALEIYPAQPILYLLNGIALNHLDQYDEAIEQLDMGLTYLIDEAKMEQDIYQQLAIAYEKKGNTTKAAEMRSKAEAITKT